MSKRNIRSQIVSGIVRLGLPKCFVYFWVILFIMWVSERHAREVQRNLTEDRECQMRQLALDRWQMLVENIRNTEDQEPRTFQSD